MSELVDLLKIKHPLVQSPMAGVQNWELAVAVSNAGALGSIPCGMLSAEQIKQELESFRQHSDKPFNINFFCHEVPAKDVLKEEQWLQKLSPYYQELDIELSAPEGALRMPFNQELYDCIAPFKPPVVSFHFGLPKKHLVDHVKRWGAVVMSSATTKEEGLWLQKNGVDVVIAQGLEAGGHRGMFLTQDLASQKSTKRLLQELVNALNVPVMAAGGIAGEADIETMMSLGASGVQIGTSFLLCHEAQTNQAYRCALASKMEETALTNIFSGRPARGIKNRIMRDFEYMSEHAPAFPYAATAVAPLRSHAEKAGMQDFLPMWSGVNRTACKEVSASELITELMSSRINDVEVRTSED